MLHQAHQVFQVEIRLDGNMLSQSFVSFGRLATHGLFRNLWELLHRYGVVFCLHPNFNIPLLWEHDRTMMDAVQETGIIDKHEQETLDWYWHYKGVHSIGDTVCSDDLTIDPTMLTKEVSQSSRDFPIQFLTGPDHKLWLKMTYSLTQLGHKLMRPLDRYIGVPHRPDVWFVSKTLSSLFLKVYSVGHDVYTVNQSPHSTRYGTTYTYSHHIVGPCLEARRATITKWLGHTAKFHSLYPAWLPQYTPRPNRLLAVLASWENQLLWKHLWIDGGAGDWIFSGLMQGLLVIGYDGFYMPHLANNVCACAAVIYCSHMNQYADITWVQKSTKKAANDYRAEILGGCSTQLIIKMAITGHNVLGHGTLSEGGGGDNMGVMQHDNSPRRPMLEKQPQSDVLQYFKRLMASSRIEGRKQHVCGHADNYLLEAEMSPEQWANCRVDKLATVALIATVKANKFISSIFPSEKFCVEIFAEQVTGTLKNAITELWG
jgi:hypothetical protein